MPLRFRNMPRRPQILLSTATLKARCPRQSTSTAWLSSNILSSRTPGSLLSPEPCSSLSSTFKSQETNVSQEQTVIVEKRGNSSSGWLWFEIFGVAGGVWGLTGHWWAGLITLIALGVALQIPIIGTLICVVLGCGLGLLAGVIAAALSAPTWACWLIGLVATGVMIGINIEDKNSDDFYD